jgi:hypothetical protein
MYRFNRMCFLFLRDLIGKYSSIRCNFVRLKCTFTELYIYTPGVAKLTELHMIFRRSSRTADTRGLDDRSVQVLAFHAADFIYFMRSWTRDWPIVVVFPVVARTVQKNLTRLASHKLIAPDTYICSTSNNLYWIQTRIKDGIAYSVSDCLWSWVVLPVDMNFLNILHQAATREPGWLSRYSEWLRGRLWKGRSLGPSMDKIFSSPRLLYRFWGPPSHLSNG